jgi:RNA polymerase sigma factor (TIGR02999 family)
MAVESGSVTALLQQFRAGDPGAERQLVQTVYLELRRLAAYYLKAERSDHTLQPTALVNEAYLRLVGQRDKDWTNRSHFMAVAAATMRRVLVDYARSKKAEKRNHGARADSLDGAIVISEDDPAIVLDVDAALKRLAELDERQARVVELRYFAGLSIEETAEVLGIASRTVKREWALARAWLHGELSRRE